MITTKEALANHRRMMMAMEETAREKQVNVQVERLNKAVEGLQETSNSLKVSLGAVLSPERTEEEDKAPEALRPLCEHADLLRSKADAIATVAYNLGDLIKRLEI